MVSDWTGLRVAVAGLGTENTPLALFLAERGAQVTGIDQRPLDRLPAASKLAAAGIRLVGGEGYLQVLVEESFDYVFLTPGMVKDQPEIVAARDAGAVITSQTNLFFSLCRAPIIGVTGSSGKSTTTTLIGQMLQAHGKRPVFVGGNLSEPLIDRVDDITPEAWVVLELSSFQLELAGASPHIAVLLNVFPNHLDVHSTLEDYRQAKFNIFRFQRRENNDLTILNFDDAELREAAHQVPANVTYFGRSGGLPGGITVDGDGWMVAVSPSAASRQRILHVSDIQLPGDHNVYNVMAAAAAALACGVEPGVIRDVVAGFRGLSHRLERVAEVNGVLFVDDSIATTPDRAAAALRSFSRPVVLIAGGYDKGIPFTMMAEAILDAPVRGVVLTGDTAAAIASEVRKVAAQRSVQPPPMWPVDTFEAAVATAAERAQTGDVVLLSPGCASYGMFNNYIERGQRFRELVQALGAVGSR